MHEANSLGREVLTVEETFVEEFSISKAFCARGADPVYLAIVQDFRQKGKFSILSIVSLLHCSFLENPPSPETQNSVHMQLFCYMNLATRSLPELPCQNSVEKY